MDLDLTGVTAASISAIQRGPDCAKGSPRGIRGVVRDARTGDPGALMKPAPESSAQEVLAGLVERVTFHNEENGFCVLRAKARRYRDPSFTRQRRSRRASGLPRRGSGSTSARATIPSAVPENLGTDVDQGDRKIPRLRNDPGHRAGLREEARAGLRQKVFDMIETEPDRLREMDRRFLIQ
jgi:exodeoxyribonuclease V alpha subunit